MSNHKPISLHSLRKGLGLMLFGCLMLLCAGQAQAQVKGTVSGIVSDTVGKPISAATVSLIDRNDSTLWGFYITDDDGTFRFKNVPAGDYRVLASYIGYTHNAETIEVTEAQPDVTGIKLRLKNGDIMIDDVLIVDEIPPVTLRGDTLEFNAGSFKTPPNAMVEDLLKKLPGVEIQSDGTIKVNGQTVNKIMVDGKEFFGSDPKIATQNLPSEAIDKIQVFDQKTDAEQVTGMDDGNLDMTINLTLKEDHKQGAFGQIEGGVGTPVNDDLRWKGKASIHAFRKNAQFSLLANGNNTNERAFSFRELLQFTGGLRDMMNGGGFSMDEGESAFPISRLVNATNQGLNVQGSGGLRASRDWGQQGSITGNYFFLYFRPELITDTETEYFLPDSTYYSTENQSETMLTLNHRLELDIRYNPKRLTKFKFKPVISRYDLSSDLTQTLINLSSDQTMGLQTLSLQNTGTASWIFSGDAEFTHGFKRRGRSIAVQYTGSYKPQLTESDLNNGITILEGDTTFGGQNIVQRWITDQGSNNQYVRVGYTEPMFNRWLGEIAVTGGLNASTNAREVTAFNPVTAEYDSLIQGLSSTYESQYAYGTAGLKFRRAGRKLNFTVGAMWQQARLDGAIPQNGFTIQQNYGQLLPNAMMEYSLNRFSRIVLNYNSNLRPPSVTQLQPLIDNSNPLVRSTGNPNLGPQTDHSVRARVQLINPGKNRFLMFFANGTLQQNGIGTSQEIDSVGIITNMPVNIQGNWNSSFSFVAENEFKKIYSRISFEPNLSLAKSNNLVNQVSNPSLSMTLSPSLRWTFEPTDSIEIRLRGNWSSNTTSFSQGETTRFDNYNFGGEVYFILPLGFSLNSEFTYNIVQSSSATTNYPLWTASISKLFLKGNKGELKLYGFDLLNTNTGITQTATSNYAQVQTFNTLNRYFMLSFTYRLTPYGGERHGGGGHRMMRMMR